MAPLVEVTVRKLPEPEWSPVFVHVYVHRLVPKWYALILATNACERALYERFSGNLTGVWEQASRTVRRLSSTGRLLVSYRFQREDHTTNMTTIQELRDVSA